MSETSEDFFPLYFTPGIRDGENWSFMTEDRMVNVEGSADEITALLRFSNGHNSLEHILKASSEEGYDADKVSRITDDLRKLGILIDSREQAQSLHETTNNPQQYSRNLSSSEVSNLTASDSFKPRDGKTYRYPEIPIHIGELSLQRRSCRGFSSEPVEPNKIISCLANAYSKEKRPVPSAGGLYPLRFYLVQQHAGADLPKGLYQYDHTEQGLVTVDDELDENELQYVFNSEDMLYNASATIVIGADLNRQNAKYANRGYRFTVIEAGHSAQNIHLCAQELGLSTLEYGGFRDNDLGQFFAMDKNEKPIISIAVGYEDKSDIENSSSTNATSLVESIVGKGLPVEWSYTDYSSPASKLLRFYRATAKFRRPNEIYSENLLASGASADPELAGIKAVAEAYERFSAGQVHYDIYEKAANLPKGTWLSPDLIKPLSDEQYKNSPYLEHFDVNKPIQWISGERADGTKVYVPIDLVFYPIDPMTIKRKLVAEADSSGMAAHVNYDKAIESALLELIERDVIMKSWLHQEAPDRISVDDLPIYYRKRASFWDKFGKSVEVLDFSHDDIAVSGVVIHSRDSDDYPYMVSGAAASIESFEKALNKAFNEAELGLVDYITSEKKAKHLDPVEVHSPADHGGFYTYGEHRSEVEWLWSGNVKESAQQIKPGKDILALYNPIMVKLTKNTDPLQIARVIAPDLVPISFGFGSEHHLHPSVNIKNYSPRVPHYFA